MFYMLQQFTPPEAKRTCFDMFNGWSLLRSRVQFRQEHVNSLNIFNETVLITVMHVSVLQTNKTFYLSKW